jgi:non-specific serine/threonine protein kinase
MVGSTVSHYKILERLGHGGMGVVYKAEDTRLGRTVALKFLADQIAKDSSALERFKREARAASALNHPNICTIHDIDEHQGQPFIVMELLEGQTVRDVVSKGVFPFDQLVTIALEICDALEQAHERGVLHRDIKPANIFVTREGRSKLLDFGLAKVVPGGRWLDTAETLATFAGEDLTLPGAVTGTVAYMSPEQAQGQAVDARADLYSFGVVLYEMATGRSAFTGATVAVLFDAILNRQPPSILQLRPDVNPELDRIITRLIAKHPGLRHQSARELHDDLRSLVAERPLSDSGRTAARGLPSIAVLPFRNLSPDPDNEYFSDGMTEEIINALSQLPGLRVAARTSSFAFKGRTPEIEEVGSKLKVSAVLSGSVRKAGDRLRLNVELVSVADGFPLWSDRFDREMADVFQIQDEVANRIVEKLKVTLSGEGCGDCLVRQPTDNFQAYELFLRGRVHLNQRVGIPRAIEDFERAIEMDPRFALAYASLAEARVLMAFYGFAPAHEAMPAAKKAADQAIKIAPTLAEPHVALAMIAWIYVWDWSLAYHEFDKALALNPQLASTLIWQSLFLACTEGKFEDAIAAARKASELDPLSATAHTALAWVYCCAGQFQTGQEEAQRALAIEPMLWTAARIVAVTQMALEKYDDAVETLEAAMVVSGRHVWVAANLIEAYVLSRQMDKARRLSDEIVERSRTQFVQPMFLGLIHALMGDRESAFATYERAFEERDGLPVINYSPVIGCPIRKEPRFVKLVRRVGMTPAPDLA